MPNTTVPAAAPGLPAAILPFPANRARAPSAGHGLYDKRTMDRCFIAASVASQYRGMTPAKTRVTVADVINEQGAMVIARVLEENAAAIVTLRAVLASLIEADQRIASAAHSILPAGGL